MAEWKEYTGSDEQIAEMWCATDGFIWKNSYVETRIYTSDDFEDVAEFISDIDNTTHYWIIPADPLREMKIRQAMTGQPVWVKTSDWTIDLERCDGELIPSEDKYYMTFYTTTPNWNIPNAEYSFTEFKD